MSSTIGPPGSKCYFCGVSTARRVGGRRPRSQLRSFELSAEYLGCHPYLKDYLRVKFPERQNTLSGRICRPCLQRAQRFTAREEEKSLLPINIVFVNKMQDSYEEVTAQNTQGEKDHGQMRNRSIDKSQDSPQAVTGEDPQGLSAQNPIKREYQEEECDDKDNLQEISFTDEFQQDFPVQNPIRNEYQGESLQKVAEVPIAGYSRVSPKSKCCLIAGCAVKDNLQEINVIIRSHILIQKRIYIPKLARVCTEHLSANIVWKDFTTYSRPRRDTFKPVQVSNMLRMLQRPRPYLNFEKLYTIDDTIFKFYIGFSKIVFLRIFESAPSLQQFKRPKRALAAVLCKIQTGDSNKRLSDLFRMTNVYFRRLVDKARKCLLNDKNCTLPHGISI